MANQDNILEKMINLTRKNKIDWKNFKTSPPKRFLDRVDFKKVKIAAKFPKKVMTVQGGYNKHQSYYALHEKLVLVLTKGARDDRLLLIAGRVKLNAPPTGRKKVKNRDFTAKLHVFSETDQGDLLSELHEMVHEVPKPSASQDKKTIDWLNDQL
ncbi:MAG TPA: hypothetical protein GX717_04795 [Clostridiaceae bacterium]|nr:hypothetical protein [Clostridiaceae bacterium]